ncbi:MAG: response regulator transcription factor [Synergistaceae bacterium]|uniref:response regulator transcription factor n=1 Tax=Aminivibrio sp. TaxID=1872489 RepID=UPI002A1E7A84|nr:response regulator transcription factor [Synergistaceae bacterium]MDD3391467.1 response regulator transcription factor [Synergistaceae bacterium]MDD3689141.1 response regulator transcription factor [Synergistaceae bacterium]MDD4612291.1 response regulator transcription factor [Synergistaceae bacterium]
MASPERNIRVLVIDDEESIRRALNSILSLRNYDVSLSSSGEDGINAAIETNPEIVILDLSLPDMDGLDVCRELRTWMTSPILILSVRGNEGDKVTALDLGADDYLTKPFQAGELLARMRAILRRAESRVVQPPEIQAGDLTISLAKRAVFLKGKEISLTRTEFEILSVLVRNMDCVVTHKMLADKLWEDGEARDPQLLRVHVSNLRKKIEPGPSLPRYILTEPGVGFRFTAE